MAVLFLVLFLSDAAITYFSPDGSVVSLWWWSIWLFVTIVSAPFLSRIFQTQNLSRIMHDVAHTPITPALGVSVVAALVLGVLVQQYLFPGYTGDLQFIIPLAFLVAVLFFFRKKR